MFSNLLSVWNQMLTSLDVLITNFEQATKPPCTEVWGDAVKLQHL